LLRSFYSYPRFCFSITNLDYCLRNDRKASIFPPYSPMAYPKRRSARFLFADCGTITSIPPLVPHYVVSLRLWFPILKGGRAVVERLPTPHTRKRLFPRFRGLCFLVPKLARKGQPAFFSYPPPHPPRRRTVGSGYFLTCDLGALENPSIGEIFPPSWSPTQGCQRRPSP